MYKLKNFMIINNIEGYSYLILLFVAMPLKYIYGYAFATKVAGMIHGILFSIFVYQLLKLKDTNKLEIKELILFFILSLIPFGSYHTDKKCKKKLDE